MGVPQWLNGLQRLHHTGFLADPGGKVQAIVIMSNFDHDSASLL